LEISAGGFTDNFDVAETASAPADFSRRFHARQRSTELTARAIA
jgi:hypothetical protein